MKILYTLSCTRTVNSYNCYDTCHNQFKFIQRGKFVSLYRLPCVSVNKTFACVHKVSMQGREVTKAVYTKCLLMQGRGGN